MTVTIKSVRFWGSDRLVVQTLEGWRILGWPSAAELALGEGRAVPQPGGARLAIVRTDGEVFVDGEATQLPPQVGQVQELAWDGPHTLLVVAGKHALNRPYSPGPSLLPVPETGCSAQLFGTYPVEGMALWRVPLDGKEPLRLAVFSGVERISRPQALPEVVAFDWYRSPVYGTDAAKRVLAVPRTGGLPFDLFDDLPGSTSTLVPSPDGDRLAFLHYAGEPVFPFWNRLAITSGDAYRPAYPLPEQLRLAGPPSWSVDGSVVAVSAFEGIRTGIVKADADEEGGWEWLVRPDGAVGHYALAPGGGEAVAVWRSADIPPAVYRLNASGRTQVCEVGDGDIPARRMRLVRWSAATADLEGLLVRPDNNDRLWPLVVDLHGGPVNGLSLLRTGGALPLGSWCDHGFAVFAPDFRGSGIAGKQAMLAAARSAPDPAGGSEADDILSGIDKLVEEGLADPSRLFLFGYSYGGFLVNHVVTCDHRFRAAVCYEGHADAHLAFCLTWGGGGLEFARHMYGGNPWQAPDRYAASSPICNVAQVRTPMLLLYGDDEPAQGICWYTALREHGVEAELVFYRDEGHVNLRPENREDLVTRSVAWFRRHDLT